MDNIITNNTTRSILLTVLVVLMITAMAGTVSAAISYVTVTSPNGGENVSGTTTLTWDSDGIAGDPGSFTLAYSADNGTVWKNIIVGLSCDMRSYSWDTTTITAAGAPAPSDGTDYAFRIAYNVSITDRSDGNFTIDNAAPTLGLDVPTADQNVSTSTVWINGTYTDATSGVNTGSLVVNVDGSAVSGSTGGTISSGYYNYSATLPDGSHNVTVDVNDYAGNVATQVTRDFKVDTVAPSFNVYTPTDNSNVTDNTPWVNATFTDAGTGVNASATTIKVNGTVVTAGESTSAKVAYLFPTALDDGTILVNVSITDYMGNTTWGNWTFVVDTVKPTLALDLPTADQNVSTSTVWINGTYTDATSGVNTSSLVVKVNGTAVSGGTISSGSYNYSATLPDGSHNVTVDVNDYAGNVATQVTRDFKVDTVAPSFNVYTPTDNSNVTDNTPWVNATFTDAGTGVNASATTIKVNGTVVTAGESTSAKVAYLFPTALDDGTILVNVSITDYTGNTTWGNWTFAVDTGLPTLGLDTPTEDQNVSTSTVWINGTYTDTGSGVNTSSLVVKVNGSVPTFDSTSRTSGHYNYSITLPDDSHNVTVDVNDYAGSAATQQLVNFTVDTQAPSVTASPATTYPGSQTAAKTGDTVTLNATVTDDGSGVSSVTVNASTINSTQTSVTLTQVGSTDYYNGTVIVSTSSSGTMSCAVNATDNCGYSNTSISLSVIVDNTAPSTPVVTDDGASTTSTTQLHANWISLDSESEIAYFYAIGNISGGTEIVDWTSTGTTANVTKTDLTLTAGQTYYFTVKAQNGAGDNSTAGNSDGITVLTSATTSYDINLVPGWNMVSTPLIPDNTAIGTVLSGMNNVLIVYAYDALNDTWLSYIPGVRYDLTDITAGTGYWFEMSASETLTINGSFLGGGGATPPTYPVYTGWNLIGFHSLSADSPYDYLSNVRGNYASKMYGYKNGAWVTVNNADVAGTDDLEPGYGYWLYMQQNGTIVP